MNIRISLCLALLFSLWSCATLLTATSSGAPSALKIASWNLEFLAEKDGTECEPRASQDYREMRRVADTLDADVIALQEAESLAAAERVFDPARYTVVMETRPGEASGTCGGRHPEQPFIRQAVGFAARKGIGFERLTQARTGEDAADPGVAAGEIAKIDEQLR